MFKLISIILHWVSRQFVSLTVIVLILVLGAKILDAITDYVELNQRNVASESTLASIPVFFKDIAGSTEERCNDLRKAGRDKIQARISVVKEEKNRYEAKQRHGSERIFAQLKGDFSDFENDLRIDLLNQELSYLESIISVGDVLEKRKSLQGRAQQLHAQINNNNVLISGLQNNFPIAVRVPGFWPNVQLNNLVAQNQQLNAQLSSVQGDIRFVSRFVGGGKRDFVVDGSQYKIIHDELTKARGVVAEKLEDNLISKPLKAIKDVFPSALMILLGAMLSPLAIKSFFYYLLAPVASRMSPICIAPSRGGEVRYVPDSSQPEKRASAKALGITVRADEELLLHPEFDRSSGTQLRKTGKFFLDNRYPLSGLASGLFLLTRVEADDDFHCTVSSNEELLSEVALIEVAEGTELVLLPKHIVGVIKPRASDLRFASHWRLTSITAWLTLQLRYLTVSGPVKILVKGCQGVRVDAVGDGQTINQSHTIGFTANVPYAVRRSSPFLAYYRGKQEIFDDYFSGGKGFYLSEVTPNVGKKSGITGKGLEGIVDSFLKVFGL